MGDAVGVRLDPVREALLAQAEAEAERVVGRAERRAKDQVARAEEHRAALVRQARAEGEAAAEREAAVELARARRRARTHVLVAQREIFDDVRAAALEAAERLRSEPGYPDLLERLADLARDELGADAEIVFDPPSGGVVGSSGTRRVDYTLSAIVERCVARHAVDLERLWR